MHGYLLVRGVFVAVVTYLATLIRPIDGHIAINAGLGLAVGLAICATRP
jgi:hypothetical protein